MEQLYLSNEIRRKLEPSVKEFGIADSSNTNRVVEKLEEEYKGLVVLDLGDDRGEKTGSKKVVNRREGFNLNIGPNTIRCKPIGNN